MSFELSLRTQSKLQFARGEIKMKVDIVIKFRNYNVKIVFS